MNHDDDVSASFRGRKRVLLVLFMLFPACGILTWSMCVFIRHVHMRCMHVPNDANNADDMEKRSVNKMLRMSMPCIIIIIG